MTDKSIKANEQINGISKATLWDWIKAICTLIIIGVLSYKVYLTPIDLKIDFPTLLSLLLALFSVGLSTLFYFKATETSNTFYDNTYKFTKDIAQLLAKIESGFGEKLRNLDEGYSSVRDYIQNNPANSSSIDVTKKQIESEKQASEKVQAEIEEIINKLVEQAKLEDVEKESIKNKLAEKEKELRASQKELLKMNSKLIDKERRIDLDQLSRIERYTLKHIIPMIGHSNIIKLFNNVYDDSTRKKVNTYLKNTPQPYIDDLTSRGFFDSNGITNDGIGFLYSLLEVNNSFKYLRSHDN